MESQRYQMVGIRWNYAIVAGLVGGFISAILVGILYTAGSPILFNSQLQSAKVLAVYNSIQPLPLLTTNMAAFLVGYFVVSIIRTFIFALLYKGIPGSGVRKGIAWGVIIWLLVIVFSEFYTAVNLLAEPLFLVAFELLLQLPAYLGEGVVVATIYGRAWR